MKKFIYKSFGHACVASGIIVIAALLCYAYVNWEPKPSLPAPTYPCQPSPFLDFSRSESEERLRNLEFELNQIKIQQHLSRVSQPDLHIPLQPYSAWRAPLGRYSQCLRFKDGQWIVVDD